MRTTVDVPEKLLHDLAGVLKDKTRNEAVRIALDDYVRRRRRARLLALGGKMDIDDVTGELEEAELGEAESGD